LRSLDQIQKKEMINLSKLQILIANKKRLKRVLILKVIVLHLLVSPKVSKMKVKTSFLLLHRQLEGTQLLEEAQLEMYNQMVYKIYTQDQRSKNHLQRLELCYSIKLNQIKIKKNSLLMEQYLLEIKIPRSKLRNA
jgi:hypothetical protein